MRPGSRPPALAASTVPRRALYVLFRYPLRSQTFVRDEIFGLRASGVDVQVVVCDPGDPEVDQSWAGPTRPLRRPAVPRALLDHGWWAARRPRRYGRFLVEVLRQRNRTRECLLRVPTAARALVDQGVDRCHTHFAWSTATTCLAFAALLDAPASITVHAKDIFTARPRALRRLLDRFSPVITVCEHNVGYLAGAGAIPFGDPRTTVVACAVAAPPDEALASRPELDLVAVGRLVPKKGFDVLLRAAAAAERSSGVRCRVDLVGDGPERAALEALAAHLGLGDRVRFLGALSHERTLEVIGKARTLCLPARIDPDGDSDAMPVVLREAMVRRVPVATTRIAGIPESVDASVGWVVAPGSVEELAGAVVETRDDEEVERRGTEARRRALRLWSPEDQVSQLRRLWSTAG